MSRAKTSSLNLIVRNVVLLIALQITVCSSVAWAGSARFVAGQGWGVGAGASVAWPTSTLRYFTDPGNLSPAVSHAQADAMVAAAAAVWAVPTSSIALTQGGVLREDVNSSNVSFDGQQFAFPADVQISNEGQVPVAVVYDEDGSLIDLLFGEGASEPDGCAQSAVVGDIDDIHQDDGTLRHATLILNGRCVGSAPEQLTQMQYQLARAFGRVLGLSWSQTNDNVFTAQSTVTAQQIAYWPLMHAMDLVCGLYTYQCVSNPFTLRPDDLNTLAQLYPVYQGAVPAGKQGTSNDALYLWGQLSFPTGQGMDWVNVVAHRNSNSFTEDWQTVSATTGTSFQQGMPTPASSGATVNAGTPDPFYEGFFLFRRVPLDGIADVYFTTEAINPLYTGDYAIGPYVRPPATPSGSPVKFVDWSARSNGDGIVGGPIPAVTDAAAACSSGGDGTEQAPAAVDPSGWQKGVVCGWGHNAWWNVSAAAGHQWTLEVTATDESGAATTSKIQPVLGVWKATDGSGSVPSVGVQAVPFNSMAFGLTQMLVSGRKVPQAYRVSISDQFGAGRPDFSYVVRVLYAASVQPAVSGAAGGQVVITGSGFSEGNQVLVNNVPATVVSWTATQIVAQVSSAQHTGSTVGVPVDLAIVDPTTGGTATIPHALTYVALPNVLQQVSAPSELVTGMASEVSFAVRVLASDRATPVPGAMVSFTVLQGAAQFGACAASSQCTLASDAQGIIRTTVTGTAAGTVRLLAREAAGSSVEVVLTDTDPARSAALDETDHYLAAGAGGRWTRELSVSQNGSPTAGVAVVWTISAGLQQLSAESVTDSSGVAHLNVAATVMAAGAVATVTGCAWTGVCATWVLHSVPETEWTLHAPDALVPQVSVKSSFDPMTLSISDATGHALEGAAIKVFQRVLGWEGSCADVSRCVAAPVLQAAQSSAVSDAEGRFTFTPLTVPDVPQVIEIAISSGAYAFVTLTLTKTP